MQPATVLSAPGVDAALAKLMERADIDGIPTVLDFLDRIQTRLVETLGTFPAHSSDCGQLFHAIVGACSSASWAAVP